MEWGSLYNIWWLIFVVIFIALSFYIFNWKKRVKSNFADPELLPKIFPNYSSFNFWMKAILIATVLVFTIIALMDPLYGNQEETVKREGVDAIFALDLSSSMDAEDIAPSRLEKAKKILEETLKNMGGDRVGLVVFAGSAYSASPLTNDYQAIQSYIETVTTDLLLEQGTNTGDAIAQSVDLLKNTKNRAKLVILISDGENHEPELDNAIDLAKEQGVQITTMGIGTEKGAPIPIKEFGSIVEYKKDYYGETIISKIEKKNLEKIAKKTKATFIEANNTSDAVNQLKKSMSTLEKSQFGEFVTTKKRHIFQWFLGIAILLLFIDSLTSERKLFS